MFKCYRWRWWGSPPGRGNSISSMTGKHSGCLENFTLKLREVGDKARRTASGIFYRTLRCFVFSFVFFFDHPTVHGVLKLGIRSQPQLSPKPQLKQFQILNNPLCWTKDPTCILGLPRRAEHTAPMRELQVYTFFSDKKKSYLLLSYLNRY